MSHGFHHSNNHAGSSSRVLAHVHQGHQVHLSDFSIMPTTSSSLSLQQHPTQQLNHHSNQPPPGFTQNTNDSNWMSLDPAIIFSSSGRQQPPPQQQHTFNLPQNSHNITQFQPPPGFNNTTQQHQQKHF